MKLFTRLLKCKLRGIMADVPRLNDWRENARCLQSACSSACTWTSESFRSSLTPPEWHGWARFIQAVPFAADLPSWKTKTLSVSSGRQVPAEQPDCRCAFAWGGNSLYFCEKTFSMPWPLLWTDGKIQLTAVMRCGLKHSPFQTGTNGKLVFGTLTIHLLRVSAGRACWRLGNTRLDGKV